MSPAVVVGMAVAVAGGQSERIRQACQKGYEGDPCVNCQQLTLFVAGRA